MDEELLDEGRAVLTHKPKLLAAKQAMTEQTTPAYTPDAQYVAAAMAVDQPAVQIFTCIRCSCVDSSGMVFPAQPPGS